MAETTHISWADATFSPWTGCTKISPACDGCYAAHLMDTRMHRVEWGEPGIGEGTRDLMSDTYWRKPLAWNREAAKTGVRPWVFPSLCDPFDLAVEDHWHAKFHGLILDTPNVFWLLLTKRIGNARKVAEKGAGRLYSADNWAIGATFANQDEWNRDGWKLKDAKELFGRMAFASFEPLLGAIRFDEAIHENGWLPDWVITGGETDQGVHKARPSSMQWYRGLRDQCERAGIPFHFKQWGEWKPAGVLPSETPGQFAFGDYRFDPDRMMQTDRYPRQFTMFGARSVMERVGKKDAGRALDGVIHDGRPQIGDQP
jgi:protein gp37